MRSRVSINTHHMHANRPRTPQIYSCWHQPVYSRSTELQHRCHPGHSRTAVAGINNKPTNSRPFSPSTRSPGWLTVLARQSVVVGTYTWGRACTTHMEPSTVMHPSTSKPQPALLPAPLLPAAASCCSSTSSDATAASAHCHSSAAAADFLKAIGSFV